MLVRVKLGQSLAQTDEDGMVLFE